MNNTTKAGIIGLVAVALIAMLLIGQNAKSSGLVTAGVQTNTCTDSDGGNKRFDKGTTLGVYNGTQYTYTDSCQDANHLIEYLCKQSKPNSEVLNCPSPDYTCTNGACVSTASTT